MKASAAVVLLCTAVDIASSYTVNTAAFRPKPLLQSSSFVPRRPSSSSTTLRQTTRIQQHAALSMLVETSGGMEELQEMVETTNSPIHKQVRKSPSLFKLAGMACIPLGAALGFGLTPSRRWTAHVVGGVVTGIAGAIGKSRIDALTHANAEPALAQAIVDAGLAQPEAAAAAVQRVQAQFGILEEDFQVMCAKVYSSYLLGMVKYNPIAKTSELKELENLRTALSLENLQVGEAHANAAREWYRQTTLVTPPEDLLEDPEHPDRMALDKLLFLTERSLRQLGETDEAFSFEMTRVAKALGITTNAGKTTTATAPLLLLEALERVASVAEPFYERALKSTRAKLLDDDDNVVSPAMLERARTTLGISDETAFDMHVACYNAQVRDLLGFSEEKDEETADLGSIQFANGAMERLSKLQETLGLSDKDANYEIAAEVTPLYQETALKAMEQVLEDIKTPDEAWDIMEKRRTGLLLQEDSTKTLVSSMVMQALGRPLEETNKFAKVNNEAATYDNLLEALQAKQALIAILTRSGWNEFDKFDETFCNPWDRQSANGFLSSQDRIKLYKIFLTRSFRKSTADGNNKLSDEMMDQITQVKGLLGITDQQAEVEARAAFGPQLQKVLQRATTEIVQDYTPELKANMQAEIETVVANFRLTDDFVRQVGATFYAKAVEQVSETAPGGIPDSARSEALAALCELFHLQKTDTFPAHMEYFGNVYKKSVLEAMGTTGVIRPEFRAPLDDLRKNRLGVSQEDCDTLFLQAVQEKMTPMVQWIGSEMERTMLSQQQLSERRGKDMGEDLFQTGKGADGVLGLGAEVNIMSDIMNLVDFYNENNVAKEIEVETPPPPPPETENDDDAPPTVVTTKLDYPVTALGNAMIDQEMAELLYRQFIVGSFTAQGEKAARYSAARATFAGILGLDESKIDEINSNIGSTVYDNYVTNALKTKPAMDQQDMMFLANIQTKLDITPEQGEKMLKESQKKVLSEEINGIMDAPTPALIKAFREKCNAMGVDLANDVGISKLRLSRMFEAEITPGLKDGSITIDTSDVLTEIQESLGIEPEECEAMFEACLLRLSKSAMDLISGELLRGRDENTVDLIKEVVRYAAFTEGDLGLQVDEATGHQIMNLYEALDFNGEQQHVEANKGLLRQAVGIA